MGGANAGCAALEWAPPVSGDRKCVCVVFGWVAPTPTVLLHWLLHVSAWRRSGVRGSLRSGGCHRVLP